MISQYFGNMNRTFFVESLGEMEFLVSLIEGDYPITFVAKKINSEAPLFIFDECSSDDNSVSWICSEIGIDDLDLLNRGLKKLNSCFKGPRNSKKTGYLITSISGLKEAKCEKKEDLADYLAEEDIFVPQFAEDDHGAGIYTLVTKTNFVSIVLDKEEYASPFIDFADVNKKYSKFGALCNTLPFEILNRNRRTVISNLHSVVLYVEVSDKEDKEKNKHQTKIDEIEEVLQNAESDAALETLASAFNSETTEKLVSALNNDIKSVEKFDDFIETFSKKNQENQFMQFSSTKSKTRKILLNKEKVDKLSSLVIEAKNQMNEQSKVVESLKFSGWFEMFDSKPKGKFRFIPYENKSSKYRGDIDSSFDSAENPIEVGDPKTKYSIVLKKTYFKIGEKFTNPSYTLLLAEKEMSAVQLDLISSK